MMVESRSAVAVFVGAVLTVSGPVSGLVPGAGVVTDPGAWTIVPEWNAIPSGPASDVNTERGCEDLCSATPGCVQWTWNYGHKVRRRVIKTKPPQTPVAVAMHGSGTVAPHPSHHPWYILHVRALQRLCPPPPPPPFAHCPHVRASIASAHRLPPPYLIGSYAAKVLLLLVEQH
jgi:hypothetical protein